MPDVDFAKLRAARNAAVEEMIDRLAGARGWDRSKVFSSFDPNACYCACPDGPCEHDFSDWRYLDEGSGVETVCARCGLGALSHSLRTAP